MRAKSAAFGDDSVYAASPSHFDSRCSIPTRKALAVSETVFEVGGLRVERLRPQVDGAVVDDLGRCCADYILMATGEPPRRDEGAEFFADIPSGHALDDMLKLGVRDGGGVLLGLIDVARKYPQPGVWYIGLLLIDPTMRNRGMGRDVVRALKGEAMRNGATRIMLSVVEENVRALRFWQAQGFRVVRKLPTRRFGTKDHVRWELALDLQPDGSSGDTA
jgi:ribosomal protein S18 acetylase RimI-like enzyme